MTTSPEKKNSCTPIDLQKWIPEFLIDDAKRRSLCFRETLIICLKDEPTERKPIGGYCILIEPIGPQRRELLVHVHSSMSIDGNFGGSKVISSATEKFHCLEEKRTEFVYKDDGLHEKTMFLGVEDDFYHVKLTHTCPCEQSTKTKSLPIICNKSFISEGVNILLMRYLALVNYQGTLCLESITIDGEVTINNYTCTPAENMELNGHYLSAYTIERKMRRVDGTVHDIKTYLTPKGKILQHDWLDVPYILKINPLADPKAKNECVQVETPLRDHWAEDIEMLSKYLDKKSCKMAEQTEYLADHPEAKQLIADYVQTLLAVKPVNVLDFTIQHFKAFAKDPKAWETSALEENSDTTLKLQLAKRKTEVVCSICGFCVENVLDKNSATSSMENSPETACSQNSATYSACSKCELTQKISRDTGTRSSDTSKNDECVEEDCNKLDLLSQLKRACEQCQTIVKACQKEQVTSECPGCLKVFSICTNCSTLHTIMHGSKVTEK